ncbi:MAG: PASTA domain-containing protein, partial [Clostridia bacterium]|nr:PASTA domain-containing protein [Clostridia bacterium]
GMKKSTIITFAVSVSVCLIILIAVIVGIGNMNKPEEPTTTLPVEETSDGFDEIIETETEDQGVLSVTLIDFRGKNIEDIKSDSTYKDVLKINTVYEDSDKEKGTVIGQDLPEGTVVSSINKRSITLRVSDGLLVPDVVGKDAAEAQKTLTDKGFKSVEIVISNVANSKEQSNKVSSIVYYPELNGNWEDIPSDRRISAEQKVVIYCYGEYTEPTTEKTVETLPPVVEEPAPEQDIPNYNYDPTIVEGDNGIIIE